MSNGKKRVLLVDDDEAIIASTRHALETRGYEVLVARDGSEALVRAERDAPDLILLDIVMPKRSGFSVLDRLSGHRQQGRPRVMVMTGTNDRRLQEVAEERGADAFLPKPFEINDLLAEVDSLLHPSS